MDKYIGVKIISAEPMNKYEFQMNVKGVDCKEENEEGYMVTYPDGYVSWSPKAVFEEAYRPTTGMTFGLAVEAVKKGYKIARTGWNGKGMFVYYVPGGNYTTQTDVAKKDFGETAHYNPYLAIRCVDGNVSTWVPSINDCLSDDWMIVE